MDFKYEDHRAFPESGSRVPAFRQSPDISRAFHLLHDGALDGGRRSRTTCWSTRVSSPTAGTQSRSGGPTIPRRRRRITLAITGSKARCRRKPEPFTGNSGARFIWSSRPIMWLAFTRNSAALRGNLSGQWLVLHPRIGFVGARLPHLAGGVVPGRERRPAGFVQVGRFLWRGRGRHVASTRCDLGLRSILAHSQRRSLLRHLCGNRFSQPTHRTRRHDGRAAIDLRISRPAIKADPVTWTTPFSTRWPGRFRR